MKRYLLRTYKHMVESSASEHKQLRSVSYVVSFDGMSQGPKLPNPCCPLSALVTDTVVTWLPFCVYLHATTVSFHLSVIAPHLYKSAGTESAGLISSFEIKPSED